MIASDYQPAWLLHARPYRETSSLAWFLTLEAGRVDAVVRGVRSRKSRYRALMQPFTPLQVRFKGQQDLKTLVGLESTHAPHWFRGEALVCGLYANELLSRLLLPGVTSPDLFRDYSLLLNLLPDSQQRQPALRQFELTLLKALGYAPSWQTLTGESLRSDCYYSYQFGQGFMLQTEVSKADGDQSLYPGEQLLAIAEDRWQNQTTLRVAKRLTRQLLQPLLGSKPLQSRQLFQQLAASFTRSNPSE